MKLLQYLVIVLFLNLIQIVDAQDKPDSLNSVDDEKIELADNNQKKGTGFQQNINLSFVHHYADFFRANAMGSHLLFIWR